VKIGDEEITREQLPAMQAWMLNPDHLRQSIQDVLNAKMGQDVMMPQTQDNGQLQTAQGASNQWNQ
jgi:hypothetical protein